MKPMQLTKDNRQVRMFLLIGGGGFLGGHVARALSRFWNVRVFDRPGVIPIGTTDYVVGDLANAIELDAAMSGCEAFAYLAHEAGASPYLDSDRLAIVRNLELFLLALESAKRCGVSKVLLFSSGGAVYGIPECLPVVEDHPLHPISAYGVAKASMEMYLAAFARAEGIQSLVIRPSNPFGPGQNPLRRQGAIAVFAHRILHGLPIEIWGEGNARKDFLYVEDFAEAVATLAEAGFDNQPYNIGSGKTTTLGELIEIIECVTGKKAIIERRPARKNDVPEFALNISRLVGRTGWQPTTSLEEGVRRTVDWQRHRTPATIS